MAPAVSRSPLRIMVSSLEKTATTVLSNRTQDAAVMVAQGADSNQVVLEVGHDVPGGGGEVGEEDVAGGGGTVR